MLPHTPLTCFSEYKKQVDLNFQAPRENLMNNLSAVDAGLILESWDKKVALFDAALQENALIAKSIASYSKQFMIHYGILFCGQM
jgi:hypothetical protein